MVAKFPKELRCSGVGLGYNAANALFAGTAPLAQTALIEVNLQSHVPPLPAFYLCAVGLLAFSTLTFYTPYCDSIRSGLGGHILLADELELAMKEAITTTHDAVTDGGRTDDIIDFSNTNNPLHNSDHETIS